MEEPCRIKPNTTARLSVAQARGKPNASNRKKEPNISTVKSSTLMMTSCLGYMKIANEFSHSLKQQEERT
jgi:hypothetical protein